MKPLHYILMPALAIVLAGSPLQAAGVSTTTTVGEIRTAYRNGTTLPGDSAHPGIRFQVIDLIDSDPLSTFADSTSVFAATRPGQDDGPLEFQLENAPSFDPGDSSRMPRGGGPGMFRGALRRLTAEEAAALTAARVAAPGAAAPPPPAASPSPAPAAPPSMPAGRFAGYAASILPDKPETAATKDYYSFFDAGSGLYIGMERLTYESALFWGERLAYEANMQFDKYVDRQIRIARKISPEEHRKAADHAASSSMEYSPMDAVAMEAQALMGYRFGPENHKNFISSEFNHLRDTYASKEPKDTTTYLDAWRGFKFNLEHPGGVTWVAYLTTAPIHGPLFKNYENVRSSTIKMAMTVQISDGIYSPLGIYRSPIGSFADLHAKIKRGSLAMLLQKGVARLVDEINPGKTEWAIVRPLGGMRELFEKSGVPYSLSTGTIPRDPDFQGPCIIDERSKVGSRDVEALDFNNCPLLFIDPGTRKIHYLTRSHWFTRSPFLGGRNGDYQAMKYFPYVIVRRADLARALERASAPASTPFRYTVPAPPARVPGAEILQKDPGPAPHANGKLTFAARDVTGRARHWRWTSSAGAIKDKEDGSAVFTVPGNAAPGSVFRISAETTSSSSNAPAQLTTFVDVTVH